MLSVPMRIVIRMETISLEEDMEVLDAHAHDMERVQAMSLHDECLVRPICVYA
jgi:hypothetical protein